MKLIREGDIGWDDVTRLSKGLTIINLVSFFYPGSLLHCKESSPSSTFIYVNVLKDESLVKYTDAQ